MSITTGGGDRGDSGLIGGDRVAKDDVRLEAYGTVDELNAALSLAISAKPPETVVAQLEVVSADLFSLGADLANPACGTEEGPAARIGEGSSDRLTEWIREWEEEIPALSNFILPGGTGASAALHLARAVCRRAERRVVTLDRSGSPAPEAVIYLNRLSDLLFMQARTANASADVADVPWISPQAE
ncbi:MAG TPA: cob(I)yrinic acid a,c-diamide adenosyltransferase [Planctomycetes bacterium]|nr:cob(I)yrinic acid a,c-diamide adenosyltransferase [Planctomycetota bacterium]HIN80557.1 cob(I)yrinic acid a,c-diamide adenosyltransferase [Planctomycetota bacterium]